MKKYISIILAVCIFISTTAFAISESDVAEFEKKQADTHSNIISDVKTEDGEDLTGIIKGDKIIPIYYFENNSYDQFSNYKTSLFYKEFQQEPVVFFVATADENIVEISRLGYPVEKSVGTKLDIFPDMYRNIMFDDSYLAKLLSDADVKDITDMRFGYFMNHGANLLFYINTDKGEFIILGHDISKIYHGEVLKAGTLYTADKIVEWRKESMAEALEDYKKSLVDNEDYWTIDENGDDIYVTLQPKTTPTPAETERAQTPKATATPKSTEKPSVTEQPQATKKPAITSKPTIFPQKLLTVTGSDNITIRVGDEKITFPDAQPFIDDNARTQIPIRAVAEMLDSEVKWDGETETVTITNADGDTVTLTIDSDIMTANGKNVQMDTAAIIKNERTYIPVRFVAEAMGLTVEWKN